MTEPFDPAEWKEKDEEYNSSSSDDDSRARKKARKEKKRRNERNEEKRKREKVVSSSPDGSTAGEKQSETVLLASTSMDILGHTETSAPTDVVTKVGLQRDGWMDGDEASFLFHTISWKDLRNQCVDTKAAARLAQQAKTEKLYKARELNPHLRGDFWAYCTI